MATSNANNFYGTGRRKEATARVWIAAGSGQVEINGRTMDEYFGRETSKMIINQPLQLLEQAGKVDIRVNVTGGGVSGAGGGGTPPPPPRAGGGSPRGLARAGE